MKRVAKILLLIGGILEILSIVTLIGCGIAAFVLSGNAEMVERFVNFIAHEMGYGGGSIPSEYFEMGAYILMGAGAGCIVYCIPMIVNAILAFTSLKADCKKGKNIAGIIFSILSAQVVTLAGFILNLIAGARAGRKPIEEKPLEEQPLEENK